LLASGAFAFEMRHLTDPAFYTLMFLVTSASVAFLMRKSGEVVRRREQAWYTSVSHDLRTPLTVIKVHAQLGRRRPGAADSTVLSSLEHIERAATRMARWIDDLLQVSRVQANEDIALDLGQADLVELAQQAIAEHQTDTERHVLVLDRCSDDVVGTWDAASLERVLDNLLGNAIKYSPAGGQVSVSIGREDGWAVLQVRDQGIGIPDADLERIFEPYTRGSNVEGRISGTGLGLAGARGVVERHGGTLEVDSREGEGSTFIVRLPLESDLSAAGKQLARSDS
jgi:signal transduction histidine kinase